MLAQWRWELAYHLVDERNWPSVQAQGLRSAASLLRDDLGDDDEWRRALREQRRS